MQFLCHILKIMRKLLTRFPIANTIASKTLVFPIPDARSHQFHASYASDSLIFPIPDARSHQFRASYASDSLVFLILDARSHQFRAS